MPSLTIFDSPFTVNNTVKMQLLKVYKKNEKPLLGKVRQCICFPKYWFFCESLKFFMDFHVGKKIDDYSL